MYEALLVVFLIVAIALVALIMLQQGKGADMGASFGAGASGTLFGSSGSANFMTRRRRFWRRCSSSSVWCWAISTATRPAKEASGKTERASEN
jgi:protein translocase SecG subunit